MTLPTNDLRLAMFEPGQTWWLDDPVRIAKITERTEVEVINRMGERPIGEIKPAVVAHVTIPTKAIEGFITPKQARAGQRILRGLQARSEDDDELEDNFWKEVYAERIVPQVFAWKKGRGAAMTDDKRLEPQVYCHQTIGESRRQYSSSAQNKKIEGKLIPADVVPPGLFGREKPAESEDMGRVAETEPVGVVVAKEGSTGFVAIPGKQADKAASSVIVDDLPYPELRRLAKENGINSFGMKKPALIEAIKAALTKAVA